MSGYDGWKTASPYDEDFEWDEDRNVTCEILLEADIPTTHSCGFECTPEEDQHECSYAGELEVSCVGAGDDYTYYWTCPECKFEHEGEVRN